MNRENTLNELNINLGKVLNENLSFHELYTLKTILDSDYVGEVERLYLDKKLNQKVKSKSRKLELIKQFFFKTYKTHEMFKKNKLSILIKQISEEIEFVNIVDVIKIYEYFNYENYKDNICLKYDYKQGFINHIEEKLIFSKYNFNYETIKKLNRSYEDLISHKLNTYSKLENKDDIKSFSEQLILCNFIKLELEIESFNFENCYLMYDKHNLKLKTMNVEQIDNQLLSYESYNININQASSDEIVNNKLFNSFYISLQKKYIDVTLDYDNRQFIIISFNHIDCLNLNDINLINLFLKTNDSMYVSKLKFPTKGYLINNTNLSLKSFSKYLDTAYNIDNSSFKNYYYQDELKQIHQIEIQLLNEFVISIKKNNQMYRVFEENYLDIFEKLELQNNNVLYEDLNINTSLNEVELNIDSFNKLNHEEKLLFNKVFNEAEEDYDTLIYDIINTNSDVESLKENLNNNLMINSTSQITLIDDKLSKFLIDELNDMKTVLEVNIKDETYLITTSNFKVFKTSEQLIEYFELNYLEQLLKVINIHKYDDIFLKYLFENEFLINEFSEQIIKQTKIKRTINVFGDFDEISNYCLISFEVETYFNEKGLNLSENFNCSFNIFENKLTSEIINLKTYESFSKLEIDFCSQILNKYYEQIIECNLDQITDEEESFSNHIENILETNLKQIFEQTKNKDDFINCFNQYMVLKKININLKQTPIGTDLVNQNTVASSLIDFNHSSLKQLKLWVHEKFIEISNHPTNSPHII